MYRSNSVSQLVMRISLTAMLSLMMFTVFGCSGTGESASDFALSPQSPTESYGDDPSDAKISGIYNNDGSRTPVDCFKDEIGFVTFLNRLRCQSVQVLVDGAYFATIEQGAGIEALLPAGKHQLVFAKLKTGEALSHTTILLKPCQEIEFATGLDACAEAMQ